MSEDYAPEHRRSSRAPGRKVTAAAVGGAAATVLIVGAQWLFEAPDAPAGLEGALATLFAFVAGYFTTGEE